VVGFTGGDFERERSTMGSPVAVLKVSGRLQTNPRLQPSIGLETRRGDFAATEVDKAGFSPCVTVGNWKGICSDLPRSRLFELLCASQKW
jgi:hypothetical protein